MSAPLRSFGARKILTRRAHAEILPLPAHQTGNNKPFSLKKTRRNWKPNVHTMDMPVNVLGGAAVISENLANLHNGVFKRGPQLQRVRLAARDKKTVDKAGGVEGLLVSTEYGTRKRAAGCRHAAEACEGPAHCALLALRVRCSRTSRGLLEIGWEASQFHLKRPRVGTAAQAQQRGHSRTENNREETAR